MCALKTSQIAPRNAPFGPRRLVQTFRICKHLCLQKENKKDNLKSLCGGLIGSKCYSENLFELGITQLKTERYFE